ncbi:Pentatricopeptide repeat-containing protein [Zea mays]|uniref:Pentatricopeptide repeat-containing protein n=1 Tax=Zea mays TaxID=4577 RepID=A0A3L6FJI0_MAIZE|nr:Pentatricopeptide repeat-containing protein [Zea mays]
MSHAQFIEHLRCAASSDRTPRTGEALHGWALKSGATSHAPVSNSLITFYCSLPRPLLGAAYVVFAEIPAALRDVASWNSLLNPLSRHHPVSALSHFRSMMSSPEAVLPSPHSFAAAFTAAARVPSASAGAVTHALACKLPPSCGSNNVFVSTALLNMYCKLGAVSDAKRVFDGMLHRNAVSWAAMVSGYATGKCSEEAFELFRLMLQKCPLEKNEFVTTAVLSAVSVPLGLLMGTQLHGLVLKDGLVGFVSVENSLVTMYAKAECMDAAMRVFGSSKERNSITWSAMITGMDKQGIIPSYLTVTSVLRACACLAALDLGKQLHAQILKCRFSLGGSVGTALSTMYSKCGNLEDSMVVFRRMPDRDVISWNSIISVFSQHGRGSDALDMFEEMKLEGTAPDHITFINLLCACSHMGLVDRSWFYFRAMTKDYNLIPTLDHYACMVDILSRAGQLKEAKDFIDSITIDHGTCLWRIVLGACRSLRDFDVGAYAGEQLMELGTEDSSAYILLSNIYAAQGKWNDVERVRHLMRLRGVSKDPGCSWVELYNRVHVFVVGEQQHPEAENINVELIRLAKHMKDEECPQTCKFLFDDEKDALGDSHEGEQMELISTTYY